MSQFKKTIVALNVLGLIKAYKQYFNRILPMLPEKNFRSQINLYKLLSRNNSFLKVQHIYCD
jgi:hypothetical protein